MYCDSIVESFNDYDSDVLLNNNNSNNESTLKKNVLSTYSNEYYIHCLNPLSGFKNKVKRRIFWFSLEKGKGRFNSYKDFKSSWDPNTNVFFEIKKELNEEMKSSIHNIELAKRTFTWFVKPSSRSRRRYRNDDR
jgi:hypothetical protein